MMEWDNNQEHHHHQQQENQNQRENRNGNVGVNGNGNNGGSMLYVKVMTDEQLETLRKQIAVYATICEQLVEMHKTLSAQQDLPGFLNSLIPPFSRCISFCFVSLFVVSW